MMWMAVAYSGLLLVERRVGKRWAMQSLVSLLEVSKILGHPNAEIEKPPHRSGARAAGFNLVSSSDGRRTRAKYEYDGEPNEANERRVHGSRVRGRYETLGAD